MKKILIMLLALMSIATTCLAVEYPKWSAGTIFVYIPEYGNMSALMKQAFNEWETKSGSLVKFKFINNPSHANIQVVFMDFVTSCGEGHTVGCTHNRWSGRYYTNSVIDIGTKENVRTYKNGRYDNQVVTRSKNHIYGVMLHEVGHAIGLDHSENTKSIMYPYDLESMQYLTQEDMRLLRNKYR